MLADLESLHATTFPGAAAKAEPLPADGSTRRRWRFRGPAGSVIGTLGDDVAENRAFISLARHFRSRNLPVPSILAVGPGDTCYLEEDLGDTTLFALLQRARREKGGITPEVRAAYLEAVSWLPRLQIRGAEGLDWSGCFPRAAFDRQSMYWDLNYFKYYFLRLARIPHQEQALEDDFAALVAWLEAVPSDTFLYRDFQSRNIMVTPNGPAFIDFQGGRRGALAYDLASLTLDAKADLPFEFRDELVDAYLSALAPLRSVDTGTFRRELQAFSLIRILQAMGAYGFRGFYERKEHFLQSVPFALRNLERLLASWDVPLALPALFEALARATRDTRLRDFGQAQVPLHVPVTSFSYKKGLPEDASGHGGGFIFDCRLLPNPGREEAYRELTGRDSAVIAHLESHEEVSAFLDVVRSTVRASVKSYQKRNFTHLSVAFGCTGGRHRSVYCAERTAAWLRTLPGVTTEVLHRDLRPA